MNATGIRQQLGLLTRPPDGAPIAAELSPVWLGIVVEANVAILQQRTGDTHVHTPAGVIVNWSPGASRPQEQLEVDPLGVVVKRDMRRRWTLDAWQVIQQIGGPDQCGEQRSRLAHGCLRRQIRQGSEVVQDRLKDVDAHRVIPLWLPGLGQRVLTEIYAPRSESDQSRKRRWNLAGSCNVFCASGIWPEEGNDATLRYTLRYC